MNSEALTDLVVEALDDVKAQDIVRLDVRDMTTVTDYMVVASGTSKPAISLTPASSEWKRQVPRSWAGVIGKWGGLIARDSTSSGSPSCAGR